MRLEGIYTPLITPFDRNLDVDFRAFGRAIDWQLDNGVHGLVVGGSTGEFFALTTGERVRQFEFAATRIAGRVPLIAGVNDLLAVHCYDLAKSARDAGADALLVAAPPYSQPAPQELVAHCRRIDRAAGLPIVLYNYPARTGTDMDEPFLRRAVKIRNVTAIKESSGDAARIRYLARHYPQLQLSAGAEDLVLEFFAWGARSWVSVIANFMPREAVRCYEICVQDGDFERGRRLMTALLPLTRTLEHGGAFLQSVKRACDILKRPGGPVRPPFRPLSRARRTEIDRILSASRRDIARLLSA